MGFCQPGNAERMAPDCYWQSVFMLFCAASISALETVVQFLAASRKSEYAFLTAWHLAGVGSAEYAWRAGERASALFEAASQVLGVAAESLPLQPETAIKQRQIMANAAVERVFMANGF